ncbi:MAG: phenylacetate--CoA ligase family protein [Deltaproteobacteria bacterium]|nr:phenylacetate--CoA ligase family protein [Deltaproteobacteria bacterium]
MARGRQDRSRYRRFWDEARETMAPAERRRRILDRVRHQLAYAYEKLPFYRRLYDRHGVRPDDVRTLEDFTAKVPCVTKDMLRADQTDHPPFGSYAGVGLEQVVRIFGSSGTTGKPTLYGISAADWERAGHAQAMAVWAMGARPDDLVHFLFPFGMFVGGWAILHGTTEIGAASFTAGAMETGRHIDMMKLLRPTVLAGTPSYCLHLGEVARQSGDDLSTLGLRTLIVGGEPGGSLRGPRDAMRAAFGDVTIADTGNTSECFPTQMNSSCEEAPGVHVFEDEVFLEVVDRDDANAPVADGERGATVYTTLWRESQPMIRFWAGDETWMTREPCRCGRSYPRLPDGLVGRLDDMLLVRGANVYPSAIDDTLRRVPGVGAEYRVIVEKEGAMDEIGIHAEYDPRWLAARPSAAEGRAALARAIEAALKRTIGLRCAIEIVEPGSLESQLFKARRVIDRRPRQGA